VTLLYLPYLPSGMQLRACVWPGFRSAELHWTLPRTSPDLPRDSPLLEGTDGFVLEVDDLGPNQLA
jgi:hypothetical protein